MAQAIGGMLPAAVGVAISPIPIIAVVLMLVSPRGGTNGAAYLVGQVLGVAGVGAAVLLISGGVGDRGDGEPATWVSAAELVVGILLAVLAVKQWSGRVRGDDEPEIPGWMETIDAFGPVKAAGAGIALTAFNPKNLILTLAGMAAIVEAGIPGEEQAIALVAFTVIASLGVATPVGIYFALGDRARPLLARLKDWMARYNAVIMAVILLLIGAKLVGDGIGGLSG